MVGRSTSLLTLAANGRLPGNESLPMRTSGSLVVGVSAFTVAKSTIGFSIGFGSRSGIGSGSGVVVVGRWMCTCGGVVLSLVAIPSLGVGPGWRGWVGLIGGGFGLIRFSLSISRWGLGVNSLHCGGFEGFFPSLPHGEQFLLSLQFLQNEIGQLVSIQGWINPTALNPVAIKGMTSKVENLGL